MRGFLPFVGMATAGVLALAATASADGPWNRGSVTDEPNPGPRYEWSGLQIGAAVGHGFATTAENAGGDFTTEFALTGTQGILSIGYDFQPTVGIVLGFFVDHAFGEIETNIGFGDSFVMDGQWAIGGRFGLLATPSTLLYASAGHTRANFEVFDAGVAFVNKTLNGYFVGLGVEQAIDRNLSVRLDYRFSDYKGLTSTGSNGDGDFTFDNEVHSARLGLSWKFGRN